MTKQTITWTQSVQITAAVDIDDGELTHWATEADHVRTIDDEMTRSAGGDEVSRLLRANRHLRAALLQSWAAERAHEQ